MISALQYRKLVAITPAKNEEQQIERCIRSVLDQTYPVTLHLVIDDGSSDNTAKIASELSKTFDEKTRLILSGLEHAPKQHGLRIHQVRKVGIDAISRFVPDWNFLLLLDADCWIPHNYCEILISAMEGDPKIAMIGAKYLKTPTKLEESSSTHVRGANHIIRRTFYDACLKRGIHYATSSHGEILLERFAWLSGWRTLTMPVTAYEGRETGVTGKSSFSKGMYDYMLGAPFVLQLWKMRRLSKDNFLSLFGWVCAKLTRKKRYFTDEEVKKLRGNFYDRLQSEKIRRFKELLGLKKSGR